MLINKYENIKKSKEIQITKPAKPLHTPHFSFLNKVQIDAKYKILMKLMRSKQKKETPHATNAKVKNNNSNKACRKSK